MSHETYPEGFSSSALGIRHGLETDWGCGFHLTDQRLIITKEKVGSHPSWNFSAGAMFGTFSSKTNDYFEKKQMSIEEIEKSTKKLDINRIEIQTIKFKEPSIFLSGNIDFKLVSGKSFKLFVADKTQAYSSDAYDCIKGIIFNYFKLLVVEN